MPLTLAGRAVLGTLASLLVAGPALAEGGVAGFEPGPRPPHFGRDGRAPAMPPETRYRDPRYRPAPPRLLGRQGPPPALFQAYLPRNTELPMYNEPPSRFPGR